MFSHYIKWKEHLEEYVYMSLYIKVYHIRSVKSCLLSYFLVYCIKNKVIDDNMLYFSYWKLLFFWWR
jgi:hypothetical protein